MNFEENLKILADITAELEKGDVPLEKAVELYENGVKLSAKCREQLEKAQLKVTSDENNLKEG